MKYIDIIKELFKVSLNKPFQLKDIPTIGNHNSSTDYSYLINEKKSDDYYKKIEVENEISTIPWEIRPKDTWNNDIAIGDKVAFILTDYRGYFKEICKGIIVGFTDCFVKVKPNNPESHYSFMNYVGGKKIPKPYILKCKNRLIKL